MKNKEYTTTNFRVDKDGTNKELFCIIRDISDYLGMPPTKSIKFILIDWHKRNILDRKRDVANE